MEVMVVQQCEYLIPLNCVLKMVKMGDFMFVYISPINK